MDAPRSCPLCAVDYTGQPVARPLTGDHDPSSVELYRVIALIDRDRGRIAAWECPDCGHRWPRE